MLMCCGVCRRGEHLFVGGIFPPQVMCYRDKGMACGNIDRRIVVFIPTGPQATILTSQQEGVGV